MPLASQLEVGNRFVGLFVGPSGAGKTPSACSFVDAHPDKMIKVFDFDGRMTSLLNTPWIDRSRIDFTSYPPIRENREGDSVNDKLAKDIAATKQLIRDRISQFNTVILDGLPACAFALVQDILPQTHSGQNREGGIRGRKIGTQNVAGPDDYFYESNGIHTVIALLKMMPVPNIIVTCHIVDEYDKEDPENPLSRSIKVSEKLAIRHKLASTVPGQFDHIFRFDRKVHSNRNNISVTFWSDIARTVYPNLPFGEVDITGKSFYKELMNLTNGVKSAS